MAVLTPTAQSIDRYSGGNSDSGNYHQGLQHYRHRLIDQAVGNGSLVNLGVAFPGTIAWSPVDTGDEIALSRVNDAASVTAGGGSYTGYIHCWAQPGKYRGTSLGTVTPDSIGIDATLRSMTDDGISLDACELTLLPFTTSGSGPDTYDTGLDHIVEVAWIYGSAVPIAVTFSGSTVTFTYSSGTPAGTLCIWSLD